ncbi:MAG TPA: Ig-like domain-containing protein [Longimicrobium sp.]|nr:Ig-like domain-containing protein [Longimicrobium sp.]
MRRTRRAAWLLLLAAAASCDSPTGDGRAGPPAALDVVSGDDQTATVGTELPQALVVRVLDDDGDPVPDQIVNFVVTAGGGSVFAGTALTDANGQASERWTLGTVAGDTQYVQARAVDASGQPLVFGTFSAVGTPGNPAAITPVGPAARTGGAGQALADSLAARVTDAYGNAIPGAAVVWSVRSGGGSIAPLETTTGADGVARAAWTLGTRLDSVQAAQAAAGVSLVTEFTAQASLPLGAQLVKVSGDGQVGTVAAPLPAPLRVALRLMDGRPVAGATVDWITPLFQGGVTPATTTTDANGEAAGTWFMSMTAGPHMTSARSPGATPAGFIATATPGPATEVVQVSGNGQVAAPGAPLLNPVVVRARDTYGNGVPGVPITWTVMSGGGSVSPASGVTGAGGTASAAWTLGPAAGDQVLRAHSGTLVPTVFGATARTSGNLGISVRLPQPNTPVGDRVTVAARMTTAGSGITMTARVMDRTTALAYDGRSEFVGTLDLAGLPRGPLELRVRAQSAVGDTGAVVVPVIHDTPPGLAVQAPAFNTVARPDLRIDADCTDDDPAGCTSVVVDLMNFQVPGARLASGTTGVHTTVSLAAQEGSTVRIRIRATDNRGQVTDVFREIPVWSNARWTEVASGGILMWDVDATRALALDSAAVRIFGTGGGGEVAAVARPGNPGFIPDPRVRGFLHPAGAIFATESYGPLYDWRAGGLATRTGWGSTLVVEGGWAAWNAGGLGRDLFREDLNAGTLAQLASGVSNTGPDVAANGDVVVSVSSAIHRYRDGGVAQVSSSLANHLYVGPVADGVNVVYLRHADISRPGDLMLWDGTAETLLAASHSGHYDAAGGWTAYQLYDAGAVPQVWVRAPDGTRTQATFRSGASGLLALAPDGRVLVGSGGRLYGAAPPHGGALEDLGPAPSGGVYVVRGGSFYLLLGRSAFRLTGF